MSEHDNEIVHVEFSHDDRLLLSCGNPMDKRIFIWDTSNGYIRYLIGNSYIVGSVVQSPEPTRALRWGGMAKDIKGRDTNKY